MARGGFYLGIKSRVLNTSYLIVVFDWKAFVLVHGYMIIYMKYFKLLKFSCSQTFYNYKIKWSIIID